MQTAQELSRLKHTATGGPAHIGLVRNCKVGPGQHDAMPLYNASLGGMMHCGSLYLAYKAFCNDVTLERGPTGHSMNRKDSFCQHDIYTGEERRRARCLISLLYICLPEQDKWSKGVSTRKSAKLESSTQMVNKSKQSNKYTGDKACKHSWKA